MPLIAKGIEDDEQGPVTYHFFVIFCLPYSKGWFILLAKDHSARFLVISQLI